MILLQVNPDASILIVDQFSSLSLRTYAYVTWLEACQGLCGVHVYQSQGKYSCMQKFLAAEKKAKKTSNFSIRWPVYLVTSISSGKKSLSVNVKF